MARGGKFTRDMGRTFGGRVQSWKPRTEKETLWTTDRSLQSTRDVTVSAGKDLGENELGAVWPIMPAEAFPKEGGLFFNDFPIPHEEIRSALLFFDKFDVPDQNFSSGLEWCSAEFRRVGVLTPSRVMAQNQEDAILRYAPASAFEARDKIEPGRWTLARPAQALGFPESLLTTERAAALTIQNALPVFARDVDLNDVLAFKAARFSELQALRSYLNELVAEIARNGTAGIEQSAAYGRFAEALETHIRVMNETRREKVWQSLRSSFDVEPAIAAGLEWAFTGSLNLGGLAAGAAMIGIKTVKGLRRTRDPSNPFEYLTSAHLEL